MGVRYTGNLCRIDIATNGGYWTYYKEPSYRISDPDWTPDNSDFRPKNGEFMNSTVNFPQRSYQLTAEMKTMNKSYLQAKYIDYKVVYDTTTFGTEAAPVLRFGKTDSDTRNMYVTVNFDEGISTITVCRTSLRSPLTIRFRPATSQRRSIRS